MGSTTRGFHWYNNGEIAISIKGPCPEGFIPGRLKYSEKYKKRLSDAHLKNHFHWYNNGVIQIQAANCPEGFKPGVLPITDATRQKMSANHSGGRSRGITKEQNSNLAQKEVTKIKIKNTLLGHEVSLQTRNKIKKTLESAECQDRRTKILREHNTFNTSKIEEIFYNNLLEIFNSTDIIRQYKEKRYPFNCDFYIKSKDLFIELNHSWTHGGHLFDEINDEDIKKLNRWREKAINSKYYAAAIETWTIRDINKYNVAKNNNLNYICTYTQSDLENLINYLKSVV